MNCIIIDDDKISRLLVEKFIDKTNGLNLLASFESAVDALSYDNLESVDLMFIDIEMPEMTGLDFMKSFTTLPLVIIISAKDHYAVEALNLDAVDYLLKPFDYSRFLKAVNKSKELSKVTSQKECKGVFIRDGNSTLIRLRFDDIIWIEALENYVLIVTEKERYTVHFTMKAIEAQIPEEKFVRVHRSFIVNIEKIVAIEDASVFVLYIDKKKNIPLAKSMKENLIKKIRIISK